MRLISCLSCATIFIVLGGAVFAYESSDGLSYIATQNDHGAKLNSADDTIYLGNGCDAISSAGEEGTWAWGNGGFVIEFANRRIGFPRQEHPVNGGDACRM